MERLGHAHVVDGHVEALVSESPQLASVDAFTFMWSAILIGSLGRR